MSEVKEESRKKKSLKNIAMALFSNVVLTVISFFTSRIIKDKLGMDVLGLNGVFANIIAILSLSELGIGSAITFALYKPLAENDTESIKALMGFFKKAYNIIALVVLILGLIILPFTTLIVKSNVFNSTFVYMSYAIFLISSVASYLWVYKRTLIIADQKNYLVTGITLVMNTIVKVGQLLVVIFTANFFLYLLVNFFAIIFTNLYISIVADKMYPYLKDKYPPKLETETQKMIISKTKALFMHSIGTVIVFGTDNILISVFSGVADAGKYTSYLSIVNMIGMFITLIFDNLKDSVGNFMVSKNQEEKYDLFKKLFFLNQSSVYICAICLLVLLPSFIEIWLGADILLSKWVLYAMIASFIISKGRTPIGTIKATAGLFENDKYAPIIESFINLGVSILLGKYLGILGVILGTIISSVCVPFVVQPFVVYKHVFSKNLVLYFLMQLRDVTIFGICLFTVDKITHLIFNFEGINFFAFLLIAGCVFLFTVILWLILNIFSKEEKFYFKLIKEKLHGRKN